MHAAQCLQCGEHACGVSHEKRAVWGARVAAPHLHEHAGAAPGLNGGACHSWVVLARVIREVHFLERDVFQGDRGVVVEKDPRGVPPREPGDGHSCKHSPPRSAPLRCVLRRVLRREYVAQGRQDLHQVYGLADAAGHASGAAAQHLPGLAHRVCTAAHMW